MSVFESGVRGDRRTVAAKFASSVSGSDGVSSPLERIGRAHVVRPLDRGCGAVAEAFLTVARLVFPVLLLVTAASAVLIYGSEDMRWLGGLDVGGGPFDAGQLALPATLFVVHLTNRRYGASYAFLQVVGAALVAIGAAVYMRGDLALLRGGDLPPARLVAAFGAGALIAQWVSIFVFDRLRGPRWWQAPLMASLFGGLILSAIAYPVAYAGTDTAWLQPMLAYMGVCAAEAIVLLVPYWLLRAVVAPLPGFGGY